MKKAAWLVAAILIAGGGTFLAIRAWQIRTFSERVLPDDVILYVQVPDIRQAAREWDETEIGRAIAQSPRKDVYRRLAERAAMTVESLIGADPRPVLRQFTRDASVAIVPLPSGRRGLAVAAYAADPAELKTYIDQKVDPGWLRRDPGLRREFVAYENVSYYKYSSAKFPPSFQPCYAMLEHHLLFASNEETIRRLLDTRAGKGKALRASKLLGDAKALIEYRQGMLAFLNPGSAKVSLERNLPARAKLLWPEIVHATGLDGLQYVVWSAQVRDARFEGRGFAGVAKQRSGLLKVLMERMPRKMESVASVPETAQFFSAVSLPDFSRLNQEGGANWKRLWVVVQAFTGVDVRRDLLETLGEEATLFSGPSEVEQTASVPVPKSAVIVRLRDAERFSRALERLAALAESRGIERTQETYNGASLSHFSFQNFGLEPTFTQQEAWFYFASNSALLKSALDTRRNGHNLASSKECRDASAGFPAEVNALSCTRVPALLRSYAVMLRSESSEGKTWIHAYGLDDELEYLAGKLSSAASYARVEKNGIAFASRSSVPAGLLALPPLVSRLPELLNLAGANPPPKNQP